eukprot:NODE_250_length_11764_cov_1.155594.p6 type:complete len:113 gc:universal NODE_250_length_11764_cov_1.155594:10048-10386(+)
MQLEDMSYPYIISYHNQINTNTDYNLIASSIKDQCATTEIETSQHAKQSTQIMKHIMNTTKFAAHQSIGIKAPIRQKETHNTTLSRKFIHMMNSKQLKLTFKSLTLRIRFRV